MDRRISRRRRRPVLGGPIALAALGLGLLAACQGGPDLILSERCAATQADLEGAWVIRHVAATLTCPAGSDFATTTAANRFGPVTVARDETLPGFRITAAGLTASVTDVTCDVAWTYLDGDTNARYECFTTFHPDTAGGTMEIGHSDRVTLLNRNGSTGASCPIPPPYLDTDLVIEGS